MSSWLLVLSAVAITAALRTYNHPVLHRLGVLGIPATSFLAGWLLVGGVGAGLAFAGFWLFLPWFELFFHVRHMDLPTAKPLRRTPAPDEDAFPELDQLTADFEACGFEHMEDMGWRHDEFRHFYRVFYHGERRSSACLCLFGQGGAALAFAAVRTEASDAVTLMTSNFPLPLSMLVPPRLRVCRAPATASVNDLCALHWKTTAENAVDFTALPRMDSDTIQNAMEQDSREQLEFNVRAGILRGAGSGGLRYTWKGLTFLWIQFLKEFVRFTG